MKQLQDMTQDQLRERLKETETAFAYWQTIVFENERSATQVAVKMGNLDELKGYLADVEIAKVAMALTGREHGRIQSMLHPLQPQQG